MKSFILSILFLACSSNTVGNREMTILIPGNGIISQSEECVSWHLDFWNFQGGIQAKSFKGMVQVYFEEQNQALVRAKLIVDDE